MTPKPTLSAGDVWRASDGSERRIRDIISDQDGPLLVHWRDPKRDGLEGWAPLENIQRFRTWIRRTNAVRVEEGR